MISDKHWMNVAWLKAAESPCQRTKVGAVLLYNADGFKFKSDPVQHFEQHFNGGGCDGMPCLRPDVLSGDKMDQCRGLHAEQAAIVGMGSDGCRGAILYVTHSPCSWCARLIIAVGIKEVIYDRLHGDSGLSLGILQQAGVKVRCIHDKVEESENSGSSEDDKQSNEG